ncbi:unnamed protein product [Paramecium sonneborni]|uniref:Uncharacterized protein n=1 Tax=Paramecium sonneborni TaxID=65129 RepID=A0A8S1LQ84_9CILI|nr:unnamed protein product [Paramecium sonneborni]
MNLIAILSYQKQLQQQKKQKNKKKLKNQKQQTKCDNLIDINLLNPDLQNYQISQKIKEHNFLENLPNNLQPKQTIYLTTSTQTDYIEDFEVVIPETEIQKIKYSYEKLLRLEELKQQYQACSEINENQAIDQINAQKFEIERLLLELDQIPQINYEADLNAQQKELESLKKKYSELEKEQEMLQQKNKMLQQNLKEKLDQNH